MVVESEVASAGTKWFMLLIDQLFLVCFFYYYYFLFCFCFFVVVVCFLFSL